MSASHLSETIGWALVHSVWQAALAFILATVISKFLKTADQRYLLNCVVLAIVPISAISTYKWLTNQDIASTSNHNNGSVFINQITNVTATDFSYLPSFGQYAHWIVWLWIAGMLTFTVRLILGYLHIAKLRRSATLIENEWREMLTRLSGNFRLRSFVQLGESKFVSAPIVLGFIKPMILVPAGMLTGLSLQEIESIFIHELAHIRRHDFIINIVQCLVEVIFFFNPFVWLMSQRIRAEREYCCDDIVMNMDVNRMNYSNALIKVAAFQNQQMLVLSATGNKNELFNRIKRVMEKSTSKSVTRNKLTPAILLLVGLLCASWITVRDFQTPEKKSKASAIGDTTKTKGDKSGYYYKKSITYVDKNGEPSEHVIENFDGDTTLKKFMFSPATMSIPAIPDLPAIPDFSADSNFAFQDMDSLPVKLRSADFEKFSKEFEENFQKHFGNFYEKHEDEFKKMMQEIQADFQGKFDGDEWKGFQKMAIEDGFKQQAAAFKAQAESFKAMAESQPSQAEAFRASAEEMRVWQEANHDHFQAMQKKMQKIGKQMQRYQQKLRDELIEDGYLGKDEEIHELRLEDDGSFEINGKKIKPSDEGKYKKLHDEMMAEEITQ